MNRNPLSGHILLMCVLMPACVFLDNTPFQHRTEQFNIYIMIRVQCHENTTEKSPGGGGCCKCPDGTDQILYIAAIKYTMIPRLFLLSSQY